MSQIFDAAGGQHLLADGTTAVSAAELVPETPPGPTKVTDSTGLGFYSPGTTPWSTPGLMVAGIVAEDILTIDPTRSWSGELPDHLFPAVQRSTDGLSVAEAVDPGILNIYATRRWAGIGTIIIINPPPVSGAAGWVIGQPWSGN